MSATTKLTTRAETKFSSLTDAVDEAQARVLSAQRRIKSIEEQRRHLGDHEDTLRQFDELTDEIKRISKRRDQAQQEFMHLSRVVTAIRTFLLGLPGGVELIDVSPPRSDQITDSETCDEAVATCREEIEKLRAERVAVGNSVPPIPDLYLAAVAHVEHLATRGRPSVALSNGKLVIRHDAEGSFGGRGNGREDALSVMAWLQPKLMIERLQEQIDANRELEIRRGVRELSAGEKLSELARIDAEILRQERLEEHYIQNGEQWGLRLSRRDDASALAILGLEVARRVRAVA